MDRALGDIDPRDDLAGRVVDEDLAVGDVDVAGGVGGDAFATAFGEGLQVAEGAVGLDGRAVGAVLGAAGDIDVLAGCRGQDGTSCGGPA